MFSAQKIREDFPMLLPDSKGKRLVYLNNAATTQKPRQVIQALTDFYSFQNGAVNRGQGKASAQAQFLFEQAHQSTAKFINAKTEEIVFTKNTTEALNLLAYTLSKSHLRQGDEVLLTKMEHHSNLVPWQQLAKQYGYKVKFAGLNPDFTLDLQDLESKINSKTKIVSVTGCSNVLGTINDVQKICKLAKENNSVSIVDAAQTVPHKGIDVKKIDCDFLAFSAHKMLGPTGTGVLFGKQEWLEKIPPFLFGGNMVSMVSFEESDWNVLPNKFEAGTSASAEAIASATAMDYLKKIGMENVFAHEQQLTKYCLEKMHEMDFVQTFGPAWNKKCGVISFNVKNIHPHDVGGVLEEYGIEVRTGHHCAQPLIRELGITGSARMSFYVYNTKEDIDLALQAIEKTFKMMG